MPVSLDALVGLPYFARTDLAWQETVKYTSLAGSSTIKYIASGDYIDVIVNINATYTNGVSAGSRTQLLELKDQNGIFVFASSPAGASAAGNGTIFTWTYATTASVASPIGTDIEPLPLYPLLPGYAYSLQCIGALSGDTYGSVSFLVVHIPTGPIEDDSVTPVVATPIIP